MRVVTRKSQARHEEVTQAVLGMLDMLRVAFAFGHCQVAEGRTSRQVPADMLLSCSCHGPQDKGSGKISLPKLPRKSCWLLANYHTRTRLAGVFFRSLFCKQMSPSCPHKQIPLGPGLGALPLNAETNKNRTLRKSQSERSILPRDARCTCDSRRSMCYHHLDMAVSVSVLVFVFVVVEAAVVLGASSTSVPTGAKVCFCFVFSCAALVDSLVVQQKNMRRSVAIALPGSDQSVLCGGETCRR